MIKRARCIGEVENTLEHPLGRKDYSVSLVGPLCSRTLIFENHEDDL